MTAGAFSIRLRKALHKPTNSCLAGEKVLSIIVLECRVNFLLPVGRRQWQVMVENKAKEED